MKMGKSERNCSLAEVKIKRWGALRFIGRDLKISVSLLEINKIGVGWRILYCRCV